MNLGKLRETETGRPGVLQSMGLSRVRHDLEAEHQQLRLKLRESFESSETGGWASSKEARALSEVRC